MLNLTMCKGDVPLIKKVALVPSYYIPNKSSNEFDKLVSICNKEDTVAFSNYNRYWHGYLIFLKPLFLFFDLGQVRMINAFIQFLLLIIILFLLYRETNVLVSFSFLCTIFLINPITTLLSLTYSNIYYLLLGSMLFVCLKHKMLNSNKRIAVLFMIIGMFCSFFDLLTYPLVTWGIPLATILYFNRNKSFRQLFGICLFASLAWVFGYAYLWGFKFIFASIVMNNWQIAKSAFTQVLLRSNAYDYELSIPITRIDTIIRNYKVSLFNPVFFLSLMTYGILWLKKKKNKNMKKNVSLIAILTIILCSPIVWYSLIVDHSSHHVPMTYRLVSISLYSLLLIGNSLLKNDEFTRYKKM